MALREVRPKSSAGFLPMLEYMRTHGIRTDPPDAIEPMQTFESVGFPADILDEVRSTDPFLAVGKTSVQACMASLPYLHKVPCSLTADAWPPLTASCPACAPQIRHAGFSAPTPIQAQAWPIALSGRDLVAIAKTGSGKTCGFLLPGMLHIQETRKDPRAGPTLLVLAPTRELAVQVRCLAVQGGLAVMQKRQLVQALHDCWGPIRLGGCA